MPFSITGYPICGSFHSWKRLFSFSGCFVCFYAALLYGERKVFYQRVINYDTNDVISRFERPKRETAGALGKGLRVIEGNRPAAPALHTGSYGDIGFAIQRRRSNLSVNANSIPFSPSGPDSPFWFTSAILVKYWPNFVVSAVPPILSPQVAGGPKEQAVTTSPRTITITSVRLMLLDIDFSFHERAQR